MSLFYRVIIRKYSSPVDLSQFKTSPKFPKTFTGGHPPNPQLYLLNLRKLNLYDKTMVILSA